MTRNAVTYKINKVVHYYYKYVIVFHIGKQARIKTKKIKEQRNHSTCMLNKEDLCN